MRVEDYIEQLKRGVGVDRALVIARQRMDAADPRNWQNLPTGPVFYTKDERGNKRLNERNLRYLHGWWTQCYHVLRKQVKK